jgi:hypothetical protein
LQSCPIYDNLEISLGELTAEHDNARKRESTNREAYLEVKSLNATMDALMSSANKTSTQLEVRSGEKDVALAGANEPESHLRKMNGKVALSAEEEPTIDDEHHKNGSSSSVHSTDGMSNDDDRRMPIKEGEARLVFKLKRISGADLAEFQRQVEYYISERNLPTGTSITSSDTTNTVNVTRLRSENFKRFPEKYRSDMTQTGASDDDEDSDDDNNNNNNSRAGVAQRDQQAALTIQCNIRASWARRQFRQLQQATLQRTPTGSNTSTSPAASACNSIELRHAGQTSPFSPSARVRVELEMSSSDDGDPVEDRRKVLKEVRGEY